MRHNHFGVESRRDLAMCVHRVSSLVKWARSSKSFKQDNPYLNYCWGQLIYVLFDYACLPFLLIVVITMWRLPELRRLWNQAVRTTKSRLPFVEVINNPFYQTEGRGRNQAAICCYCYWPQCPH